MAVEERDRHGDDGPQTAEKGKRWANKSTTGCWASSGYSVQGCAQLEQKLRQCMDQPVCHSHGLDMEHALTPHTARQEPEEEQHQLPPVEDVPQDHRPSQAKLGGSRIAAHRTLYTTCIPTARRHDNAPARAQKVSYQRSQYWDGVQVRLALLYISNIREGIDLR